MMPTLPPVDPAQNDGIMSGFPPPADKIVTLGNFSKEPYLKWYLRNRRQLTPTKRVWRGRGDPSALAVGHTDLTKVDVDYVNGSTIPLDKALRLVNADGFLVMYKGSIVFEAYFDGFRPHDLHALASVSKAFVGILAGIMTSEGKLDPGAPVEEYVPELISSAFGGATIQQLLDMQVAAVFYPDPADAGRGNTDLHKAAGFVDRGVKYDGPKTIYEYLMGTARNREHGAVFEYNGATTEALAWAICRIAGMSLADLLSERIWQRLGMEEDAYYAVDSIGTEQAAGSLNATLRDLARFAEMIRNNGNFQGKQIIPSEVVAEIHKGGSRQLISNSYFADITPGYSYRNQWWVSHDEYGSIHARGKYGQRIGIYPEAEVAIVQFSSVHNYNAETTKILDAIQRAVVKYLTG